MSDVFREIDEEVRRDKATAIVKKYGNVFIAIAVLAVAGVAGWQFWQQQERKKAEAVGAKFEEAVRASRDNNASAAEATLAELAANAPAGYRLLSRFRLASEVGKRDAAAGATAFDAIANDASLDQYHRDLARLRAGLLRVDILPYAGRHSAREVLGISALKANLFEDAGRWFDAVVADPQSPQVLRQRVELYLTLVRGGPVAIKN